jgi:ribosomal-protein-alanine N-acetyltransferase
MLTTERLVLRRWRQSDLAPFAAMNADPQVMEHFPGLMTRAESDALVARIEESIDQRGFGFWALERDGEFLGLTGLSVPRFEAPFMPAVEVGWRLARHAWGHGYATEAARAAIAYGFTELGLGEIVAFTVARNTRSRAVMDRLGMTHDPDGAFDHPLLPEWPLRRHVLYRLRA